MAKLVGLHGWRKLLALVFLITSSKVAYATSQALIVPIYDSERPPLFFNLNERQNGVYIELFETILRSANIQYELVPVPKLRARIMFETGETVLSCCDNEAWRQRPKEKDVQLFSNAFFHSADYVIVHKDTEFDFSKSLSLSIGIIRGFGYSNLDDFGKTIEVKTEAQLLQLVNLKRVDAAIVNDMVAQFYIAKHGLDLKLAARHDHNTLHIRVHKSRDDLLPRINKAIAHVIESGQRTKIVRRYFDIN